MKRHEQEGAEYSPDYVVELLRRISVTGSRHVAMLAKRMGLSFTEVVALHHLHGTGGLTPKRLGELMYLTPGAVTQLADRLERVGYLERIPNPPDRRSFLLKQTPTGEEEALRYMAPFMSEARRDTGELSSGDRELVGRFLENIMQAMDPPPGDGRSGR